MDEKKIQAIVDWTLSKKVYELRSFLGLANYYRKFIKGYLKKLNPFDRFTQEGLETVVDGCLSRSFQ